MLKKIFLLNFVAYLFMALACLPSAFSQGKYYIVERNPWGLTGNQAALNAVLGAGTWTQTNYSSTLGNTIFNVGTTFVMMEGGDDNEEFVTFFTTNRTLIENWVANGGKLFIKVGPNYWNRSSITTEIELGFSNTKIEEFYPGAVTLNSTGIATVGAGPYSLSGTTSFNGSSFAHGWISGNDLTVLMTSVFLNRNVLSYKSYGTGIIMISTMTEPDFITPKPQSQNLLQNTIAYTYNYIPPSPSVLISSQTGTLTSCAGYVSNSPTTFTINGSNLSADVIITAPSNFEISSSPTGTFSSSLSITTSGTVSQTLYARLTASAPTGIRSGTITATSTGASTVTTTISGTVNSLPLITISATEASMTANDNTVCKNASVTLTASGGDTYVWNTGETLTSITPTPGVTTTFTVTGTTTSSGCSNTATKLISVYAAPTLSAGSLSLCAEATYLIDKTTDVPATNGWSTSDPNVFSVNSAGYITATASGTATATITYTDACGQSVSQTVSVVTSDISTQITNNRIAYKFNGNPQGPTLSGSTINYVGYDGYTYLSQTQPTQVGYYKANIQLGDEAGCPNRFYIFNCTNCGN